MSLASAAWTSGNSYHWVGSHPDVGFHQAEGIRLVMVASQGASDCVQQLVVSRVDGCLLIQDPVLNRAAEEGEVLPIKFVYNYGYQVTNEFGVHPDSDVTTVEDLRGGTIGVPTLAADTYRFAQNVFERLGIDPEEQEYVAVGQGATASNALYSGEVDALVSYDIEWAVHASQGFPVTVIPNPDFIAEVKGGPIVAVRAADVEERPDHIVRVLRSLVKSTLFSITNPEAALQLHWEMFPESKPPGELTDEDWEAQLSIMTARLPRVDPRNYDYIEKWGEFNEEGWVAYVENILGHDVPEDVDPADFYTNELIDEVNDFDEAEIIEFAEDFTYSE